MGPIPFTQPREMGNSVPNWIYFSFKIFEKHLSKSGGNVAARHPRQRWQQCSKGVRKTRRNGLWETRYNRSEGDQPGQRRASAERTICGRAHSAADAKIQVDRGETKEYAFKCDPFRDEIIQSNCTFQSKASCKLATRTSRAELSRWHWRASTIRRRRRARYSRSLCKTIRLRKWSPSRRSSRAPASKMKRQRMHPHRHRSHQQNPMQGKFPVPLARRSSFGHSSARCFQSFWIHNSVEFIERHADIRSLLVHSYSNFAHTRTHSNTHLYILLYTLTHAITSFCDFIPFLFHVFRISQIHSHTFT